MHAALLTDKAPATQALTPGKHLAPHIIRTAKHQALKPIELQSTGSYPKYPELQQCHPLAALGAAPLTDKEAVLILERIAKLGEGLDTLLLGF